MSENAAFWRRHGETQVDPFLDPVAYLHSFGIEAELVQSLPPDLTAAA